MFLMWLRSAFSRRPGRINRRLRSTGGATVYVTCSPPSWARKTGRSSG